MPLPTERFLVEFPTGRGDVRVAALFPNTYAVGIANLGFHTVLRELIDYGGCDIRRFFFDADARAGERIVAPEGGSLKESDIIFVSIAYELDYINLVRTLMESGIKANRSERGGLPLVLAGGVAPSANPRPLNDIVDAAHIGDCEGYIAKYLEPFKRGLKALRGPGFTGARESLMDEWGVEGNAYISMKHGSSPGEIPQWALYDGFENNPGWSIALSPESVWSDTFLVETSRGCDRSCSFCMIGHNRRGCRNASLDALTVLIGRYAVDAASVGLIGSSVGSYPGLVELVENCIRMGKRVGVSSLYFPNASDELLGLLASSGERNVTLAVETGSHRLQEAIGKLLPWGLVAERVKAAYDAGMASVKLYFVIGMPGEALPDIEDSVELVKQVAHASDLRSRGGSASFDIGVSCFVPKAGTPWESMPMLDVPDLKGRLELMRLGLLGIPNLSISAESPEMALFQGILSVGDETTGGIILDAAESGEGWRKAFRNAARKAGWMGKILENRSE